MKNSNIKIQAYFLFLSLIFSQYSYADRLMSAAERGRSTAMAVGQTTSVIAIILGGIFLSLGVSQLGKTVLMGGLIGAAAIFGGPALIETFRSIFGA